MKYISIENPLEVVVKEKEIPTIGEGQALLKMRYGGICGTDLSIYRGKFAYGSYPIIPGHEFAAEIVEISENDKGLEKGMIVTGNPYFNCGHCYSCQRGLVNACMSNETMGAMRDGAYQDYFVMPIERLYDGKGMDPKKLAVIEPFCISFHGVKLAMPKPGEKVLVVGSGTIGILAAKAAKYFGAEVYVCDIDAGKLEYAKNLVADGVILNDNPDTFMDKVNEITDGNGFDVAIEAVGFPSTFQNCIDSAAFGGRIVLIGISKLNLDFAFNVIQRKELKIYGSRNALKEDFLTLIDLVGSGKINIDGIVTDIYPMEKMGDALHKLSTDGGKMLKVLLEF